MYQILCQNYFCSRQPFFYLRLCKNLNPVRRDYSHHANWQVSELPEKKYRYAFSQCPAIPDR